jgi:hypothetical protein
VTLVRDPREGGKRGEGLVRQAYQDVGVAILYRFEQAYSPGVDERQELQCGLGRQGGDRGDVRPQGDGPALPSGAVVHVGATKGCGPVGPSRAAVAGRQSGDHDDKVAGVTAGVDAGEKARSVLVIEKLIEYLLSAWVVGDADD